MTTVYDKIEMWAIERNLIDGSTSQAQFVKLAEELGEVAECISKASQQVSLRRRSAT